MPDERSKLLQAEGLKALQAGKQKQALDLFDRALETDPDSADIYGLRGVAFAQMGRGEPATESLRRASMLEPSAKTFFNLAVHLYDMGQIAEAHETVQEAIKLDPKHAEAKKLRERIAGKGEEPEFNVKGEKIKPNPSAKKPYARPVKKHLFAVLEENEKPWTNLGWTIVGLSVVSAVNAKFNFPLTAPAKVVINNSFLGYTPQHTPLAMFTIAFFVMMILACMFWTSVDLIDRRGRAIWMVPMMIFCFLWLPGLPMALYLFAGRRE